MLTDENTNKNSFLDIHIICSINICTYDNRMYNKPKIINE